MEKYICEKCNTHFFEYKRDVYCGSCNEGYIETFHDYSDEEVLIKCPFCKGKYLYEAIEKNICEICIENLEGNN